MIKLESTHVVYFSVLYEEVFICRTAAKAKQIVKVYEKLNKVINRKNIKIISGPCSEIFSYKIPEFIKFNFTWNISQKDHKKFFDYISDVPMKAR